VRVAGSNPVSRSVPVSDLLVLTSARSGALFVDLSGRASG